jgi:hypothetical protein
MSDLDYLSACAALRYLVRVGAFDPDTPPNSIREAAIIGPAEGRQGRIVAAEHEWDAHMAVVREACGE